MENELIIIMEEQTPLLETLVRDKINRLFDLHRSLSEKESKTC